MPTDLRAWVEELNAFPKTTWADCKPGGCWYAERINMEPFADFTLPFSVVQLAGDLRRGEWGMANLVFDAQVSFWRVVTTDGDGSAFGLIDSLNDMVNALWPASPLTAGQVISVETVSWSDDLLPNQMFRSANRAQRAGVVTAHMVVGGTR